MPGWQLNVNVGHLDTTRRAQAFVHSPFGRSRSTGLPMLQALLLALAYQTKYYDQLVDHFGFGTATFRHRFLYNDTFWGTKGPLQNGCRGPILFYTGNEGPITGFYGSNGFMTDVLAPEFGALLVFAEERYYGTSQPQGTSGRFDYLSTEMVLADYAALISSLRKELDAQNCPCIAFGGSYGGTLTTLFRLKYPHVVQGGLAASAPLGYYSQSYWAERNVSATTWFSIVQRTYDNAASGCYASLVAAVDLTNATVRAAGGPQRIQQEPAQHASAHHGAPLCRWAATDPADVWAVQAAL